MSDGGTADPATILVLDFELEAPPPKVWRALSRPELRAHWLPDAALAEDAPSAVTPGRELQYRMREAEPPFLESVVTFQIAATPDGGTSLRVIHELTDARLAQLPPAANGNRAPVLRAA